MVAVRTPPTIEVFAEFEEFERVRWSEETGRLGTPRWNDDDVQDAGDMPAALSKMPQKGWEDTRTFSMQM
jgi:hypothetical protein